MTNTSQSTIKDLFDHLDQKQVTYNKTEIEAYLGQDQSHPAPSLLIAILSAIGVLFATAMILATLMMAGILDVNAGISFLICGGLSLGLAIFLSMTSKITDHPSSFSQQIILAATAVGKILLCYWVASLVSFKSDQIFWALTGTMALLTGLTYFTINSSIDKFFSCLTTLVFLFASLIYKPQNPYLTELAYGPLYGVLLGLALWLLLNNSLKATWQPLAFALLIFTCILLPLWPEMSIGLHALTSKFPAYTVKLSLMAGFLITAYMIAKQHAKLDLDLIIITLALTIILALYGPQNILAALIILILGYYKFNRPLLVLGLISFIYFLISYYYQLNITLLQKSGLLLISGTALLAGWAYLHFFKTQQGESQ